MKRIKPKIRVEVPANAKIPISAPLPGEGLPYWNLLKAKPCSPIQGLVLSEKMLIAEHHFEDKSHKNFPCLLRIRGSCPYCDQLARQVYGYVVLIPDGFNQPGIVFVPPKSVRDIDEFRLQKPIAGRHLEAKRAGASMKSRLNVMLSRNVLEEVPHSKQIDPELVYRWLWNYWGYDFVRERKDQ